MAISSAGVSSIYQWRNNGVIIEISMKENIINNVEISIMKALSIIININNINNNVNNQNG
jgi:hypothetical protein